MSELIPEEKIAILWNAVVIGGGVAGSVAAIHLSRQGAKVVLLEKERGPVAKVCGEFIGIEGVRLLSECGIDFDQLNASTIQTLRLHGPERSCEIRLPFEARGVSRTVLDQKLLELAAESGVEVRSGVVATKCHEGPPFVVETSAGTVIADRLVVATGKHELDSVQLRQGRDENHVALRINLSLKPSLVRSLSGSMELFVFKGGYGTLALVGERDGLEANLCISVERELLDKIGADWDSVASYVARNNWDASAYFDGAEPKSKQFASISWIPYGFMRSGRGARGVFCVGDQMAVMPSIIGDGISIAAMTGREAASAIFDAGFRELRSPDEALRYEKNIRRRLKGRLEAASGVHRLLRNPQASDLATYAVKSAPWLAELVLLRMKTGAPLDLNWLMRAAAKRLPT